MKKPNSGSKRSSKQNQSTASDQPETPKWRPVFGQKLPPGFKPPTQEAETDKLLDNNKSKPISKPTSKSNVIPPKKIKPESWPNYFAKMNPMERIL